eukprot:1466664-Ditylum_brightwellii.AAC.1
MHSQNEYVKEIKCITIKRMIYAFVWSPAPMKNDHEATIAEQFHLQEHGIKLFEQTQWTNEKGKWFLLNKSHNAWRVQNFVDREHLMPGYDSPTWKSGLVNKSIGSYADVLQQRIANRTFAQSSNEPEQVRKKIMIQIDNDNLPALPGGQPHAINAISLATSTPQFNCGGTYIVVSETTLKEMNEKFEKQLAELKVAQEHKLQEMKNKLHVKISSSITAALNPIH